MESKPTEPTVPQKEEKKLEGDDEDDAPAPKEQKVEKDVEEDDSDSEPIFEPYDLDEP